MILYDIADSIARRVETTQDSVEAFFFEPTIRIGVTGLSRAGKTVFITSLVANLLNRGRMPQLRAAQEGRILGAYLQPQPDDDVPRFDYETHLAALRGDTPTWPSSTRTISQLRLSLKVAPSGILSVIRGPRTVHLDIVDYPGEWLLDLPLMTQGFADWSRSALDLAGQPGRADLAADWRALLAETDAARPLDEPRAAAIAAAFTQYLAAARAAGFSDCAPGRFLMPGDLEGSPALTFAPLPEPEKARSGSLYRAFERRFESYKRVVVKPFFRTHFAKLDRQIVLVDALNAIHNGPRALEDLRGAMADILQTFRPGKNSWLAPILGKRVERILFAATKADHLHQDQHPKLAAIMDALVADARARAEHHGADTAAMAIAALRATTEDRIDRDGTRLGAVRGHPMGRDKPALMYPGTLPSDPAHVLAPAREQAETWLDKDFSIMRFAPPRLSLAPGDGPPHIRLDKALEFLIGDLL